MATNAKTGKQIRVKEDLVEKAKVVFVKKFDKDYENQDMLGNEIFEWFINNAMKGAKRPERAA